MRSALAIPGIEAVQIEESKKPFTVKYDSNRVKPEAILAALEKSGEGAKQIKN